MKKRTAVKALAAFFCVVLVASAFLSMVLQSSHAMHDCMKDQCVICATLVARNLLRTIAQMLANTMIALIALLVGFAHAACTARRQKAATLITQKVRMNP